MKLPHLRSLVLGYFHEDWLLEASSLNEAVRQFVAREPPDVVAGARRELKLLLASNPTESQLRGIILEEWKSSYNPEFDGTSMRSWLEEVRRALGEPILGIHQVNSEE